jgi:SAM-dependent methyltransferase
MTCNVCGESGKPLFDFPDLAIRREHRIGVLRETIQCKRCGATMRHRFLAHALLRTVGEKTGVKASTIKALSEQGLAGLRVLDTDAYSPISKLMCGCATYSLSSFRPDRDFGTLLHPQHHNVDLQAMPFSDGSFDIVMTSDVMEHVRHIDKAHAEIARVLSSDGVYLFTVPYDESCDTHHVLVDASGPEDAFLVPPQYHGDPITGGILAYRVFGRGIFGDLDALGMTARFEHVNDETALIVDGDVFIARKR